MIQRLRDIAAEHHRAGRLDLAAQAFERLLAVAPSAPAFNDLGIVHAQAGRLDDARHAFERALAIDPSFAPAQENFARALLAIGEALLEVDASGAEAALARAIETRPEWAEPVCALAGLRVRQGRMSDAVQLATRAAMLDPAFARAHNYRGMALMGAGEVEAACAAFRRAIDLDPAEIDARQNLLLALHYLPGIEPAAIFAEHQDFARRHASVPTIPFTPHVRATAGQLRVGYVSGDFRAHAVAFFIEPVLAAHDRAAFDVHCYSTTAAPDAVTRRLQSLARIWHDAARLDGDALAQQILRDGIDVLVDLSGHTGGNRLLAFARKPAPVQITWLGYPDTTGLRTIDFRLSDEHLDPTGGGSDQFATEQIIRLPNTFACYRPPADAPPVNDLPARSAGGRITFGSFNYLAKLNDSVLDLWTKLMREVEGSPLILSATFMNDPAVREKLAARFASRGIDSSRLELLDYRPMPDYLALHHKIDVILDPFPFTGHTTTLHGLWMGVPSLSLIGRTHVSRRPLSIMSNLGLTDLVASTPEQFIDISKSLCADLDRLAELRATMRQRMQNSPLLDAKTFTSNLEGIYRQAMSRPANPPGRR